MSSRVEGIMRFCRIVAVSMGLAAATAAAQGSDPAPATSIRTTLVLQPAPPAPVDYRLGSPNWPEPAKSPFRFVDANEGSVLNQPPPRPSDRAAVLGTERAWVGGRPPLDCAATPMDASCH